MGMEFVAGIDGGGTKTRVCCRTLDGNDLGTEIFGAFNMNGIGREKFVRLLDEITAYLNGMGICRALCIGSAGISNEVMAAEVAAAMDRAGIANWKLVGDNVIAMYGALDGQPGISLIAGTGSICFGRDAEGREARSGGWGHLIGDEGSAYALGRDALSAVAHAWDGYGEKTVLTDLLASQLGLDTQRKIISYVYSGDKSAVADLSPLVETAARQGDAAALAIVRKNAGQMAELVGAVADRLGFDRAEVAMLGGMLENDTCLRAAFLEVMGARYPHFTCVLPRHDACTGAVMMAATFL